MSATHKHSINKKFVWIIHQRLIDISKVFSLCFLIFVFFSNRAINILLLAFLLLWHKHAFFFLLTDNLWNFTLESTILRYNVVYEKRRKKLKHAIYIWQSRLKFNIKNPVKFKAVQYEKSISKEQMSWRNGSKLFIIMLIEYIIKRPRYTIKAINITFTWLKLLILLLYNT